MIRLNSIRSRLILQLIIIAAILSWVLFVSVRTVADQAVETTQDSVLGAATLAFLEELRGSDDGISVDIPYAAFSILGAMGQDRVFYRIIVGDATVTGYDDLPMPIEQANPIAPVFYSQTYRGDTLRLAASARQFLIEGRMVNATVIIAQTQSAKAAIVDQMVGRAAFLGLVFFIVAAGLGVLTARSVLRPMRTLAEAVGRRGPQDLRPVLRSVPDELRPFVGALNGFIARLSNALGRTETLITEAAHHIRTPLATLRANAELARHETNDRQVQSRLDRMIRAVDDTARSATQLLDHAAIAYRTDQRTLDRLDPSEILTDVIDSYRPIAEMRDIRLFLRIDPKQCHITADRIMIESALRNLVDNAVKYSNDGQDIDAQLDIEQNHVVIKILDRGRGLSGRNVQELTQRFQRGVNVGDVVGTGLGLTIVTEVAHACGGHFHLIDREGGGTCAEFSLPL